VRFKILTQMTVRNLVAGKYAGGQGLWLIKRDQRAGKWVLRLAPGGMRKEMGLGRWPDVSISKASEKAAEARTLQRAAICPLEERRKAKRVIAMLEQLPKGIHVRSRTMALQGWSTAQRLWPMARCVGVENASVSGC